MSPKKVFCEDEIFEIFEKKIFSLEGEKKIHFSWNWHRLRKKKLETSTQNYRIFFSILRPVESKIGQKNRKIAISRPQGIFRARKYLLRKRIFFDLREIFWKFFSFFDPKNFLPREFWNRPISATFGRNFKIPYDFFT